ncbi:1-acyl-sn-glycerol-3-phosphate acyltransferase [Aureispira anguillae]|uniref:1-acyl-sn-glycerol-3-phosphate acyltransferase n=1 Tax=Aureispira anguillae TaxID=2864201 RepID=A0A915YB78_9BACT|nr:1-acyl-sn-glycerol-3-phosphate acyltransferase [Aureispira anguillae]BDS09877.1 1-acyl-sn-glycerol-3-phosphate acyltransferase [Aureispira anguillae]
MIYQLLRLPLVVLFFFFYRRIYITGKENIPQQAPTLIASNHSTAFMEQILVASLQKRSVYFWARGSVFEEKWSFPKLFAQAHLIPIWRPQEGLKKMQQNQQIFEDSKDILLDGKMFFIAPEGNSVPEKRLRTFKTGTARLALLAAAADNFDRAIFILPTGVNYTYHCDFRSEVMVHFGAPISIQNYQSLYEENPVMAAKQLTQDLKAAISKEVVIIDQKEDELLVEQLHILMRNENEHYKDKVYSNNEKRLRLEQKVANTCNQLSGSSKMDLLQQSNAYFQQITNHQLTDLAVQQQGKLDGFKLIQSSLLFPFSIVGQIGGAIPVKAARYLRNTNVEDLQFWAPMAVVFSLLTWMIYSLIIGLVGSFFIGWNVLFIPPLLVGLQYIAFSNQESWSSILTNRNYRYWKNQQPSKAQKLERDRALLVKKYKALSKNIQSLQH